MRTMPLVLLLTGVLCAVIAGSPTQAEDLPSLQQRVHQYSTVRLTADLGALTEQQRSMLPLLIEAAQQMDIIFWQQAYGDRQALWDAVQDPMARKYLDINYGPWDRLDNDRPFIDSVGAKPRGANFYPPDLTKQEFETHLQQHPEAAESFKSLYTMIRRDANGGLVAIAYHDFFQEPTALAAQRLVSAAELSEDEGLKKYLLARSQALLSDQYRDSDISWLDMKTNTLDIVIGPIETYEDQLFGYKAAHEAYVLIKDREWSARLSKYAKFLPDLQRGLPVADQYKQETPGSDSDLNAYDVVFYAGDCNAASKTIAINLPNDEQVQLTKGTRRLQLKNVMQAKFERITIPIADALIVEDQRKHVTFDAFFTNTMFHEVAHGLGIKHTITGKGTVRNALQELASSLEEAKADILGLHLVAQLFQQGELTEGDVMDNYVTCVADIFRSIRFGAGNAHGQANLLRFNFLVEQGAVTRDETGRYRIDREKMPPAISGLSARIVQLQGDGDYAAAGAFRQQYAVLGETLQQDLVRLGQQAIPVDVVFEQGLAVLGIK